MSSIIERYTASAAIGGYTAVGLVPGAPQTVKTISSLEDPFIGVSTINGVTTPGDHVDVVVFGPTKATVTGAVEVGDALAYHDDGTFTVTTSGPFQARALAASVGGGQINILLIGGYLA